MQTMLKTRTYPLTHMIMVLALNMPVSAPWTKREVWLKVGGGSTQPWGSGARSSGASGFRDRDDWRKGGKLQGS